MLNLKKTHEKLSLKYELLLLFNVFWIGIYYYYLRYRFDTIKRIISKKYFYNCCVSNTRA